MSLKRHASRKVNLWHKWPFHFVNVTKFVCRQTILLSSLDHWMNSIIYKMVTYDFWNHSSLSYLHNTGCTTESVTLLSSGTIVSFHLNFYVVVSVSQSRVSLTIIFISAPGISILNTKSQGALFFSCASNEKEPFIIIAWIANTFYNWFLPFSDNNPVYWFYKSIKINYWASFT